MDTDTEMIVTSVTDNGAVSVVTMLSELPGQVTE